MIQNLIDLTGRRIVVAGGSSGIGRQTAVTLSKLGASVVLIARREMQLKETMEMLEETGKHCYYAADLSNVNEIEMLVKNIIVQQGPLDGLLYAAGIGGNIPLSQSKRERLQSTFDINFFGFMEMVRQVCKKGRFREGMRIVGVSSVMSLCGDSAQAIYAASKGAMDAAMRCIAKEMAGKGIAVNTIAPGMTGTSMYEKWIEKHGEESGSNQYLLKRQYLGIMEPQDIANAAAFLLSPAARFITGVCLPVDGGYTSC